jgi:hypothetical protein
MNEPESPTNLDALIEQKKQELAELAELQRLAAKHKLVLSAAQIFPAAQPMTIKSPAVSSTGFDGTVRSLVTCYRSDKTSPYHKLKFAVRKNYESSLNRLIHDLGHERVADLDAAKITYCYETKWAANNKLAMGHNMVGKLRMLSTYGSTALKDDGCTYLAGVLAHMHTKPGDARTEQMTVEHVNAIRRRARETGRASIALVQAFQFEVPNLRQLDLIGEYVPLNEAGTSEVMRQKGRLKQKWLRGLRWTDIDEHLILRKMVTKSRKAQPQEVQVDLNQCPMIMEELFADHGSIDRSTFPVSGPVVASETTGLPYSTDDFRRKWREIANEAGVPPTIRNSDSIRPETKRGTQRTKATIPGRES